MADLYKYRKPVRRHWYRKFRLRLRFIISVVVIILLSLLILGIDLYQKNKPKTETSAAEKVHISSIITTFHTPYFEFQDSGKWVLFKKDSSKSKFVFYKYRGLQPQQQLVVYINQQPIPLYLATSRVVPVRIVNENSLDVTNIYGPCGAQYQAGDLHKVKTMDIQGAKMLCDPDTPQYSVVLSEMNGNWQLNMKRKNGSAISFVITFKDMTFNPGPESILRIANTFKTT